MSKDPNVPVSWCPGVLVSRCRCPDVPMSQGPSVPVSQLPWGDRKTHKGGGWRKAQIMILKDGTYLISCRHRSSYSSGAHLKIKTDINTNSKKRGPQKLI